MNCDSIVYLGERILYFGYVPCKQALKPTMPAILSWTSIIYSVVLDHITAVWNIVNRNHFRRYTRVTAAAAAAAIVRLNGQQKRFLIIKCSHCWFAHSAYKNSDS